MSVLQTDSFKFAFCEVWVVITDVEKAVSPPLHQLVILLGTLTNAFHCHVEKIDLCLYSRKYRLEYGFKTGCIQTGHLRECERRWV